MWSLRHVDDGHMVIFVKEEDAAGQSVHPNLGRSPGDTGAVHIVKDHIHEIQSICNAEELIHPIKSEEPMSANSSSLCEGKLSFVFVEQTADSQVSCKNENDIPDVESTHIVQSVETDVPEAPVEAHNGMSKVKCPTGSSEYSSSSWESMPVFKPSSETITEVVIHQPSDSEQNISLTEETSESNQSQGAEEDTRHMERPEEMLICQTKDVKSLYLQCDADSETHVPHTHPFHEYAIESTSQQSVHQYHANVLDQCPTAEQETSLVKRHKVVTSQQAGDEKPPMLQCDIASGDNLVRSQIPKTQYPGTGGDTVGTRFTRKPRSLYLGEGMSDSKTNMSGSLSLQGTSDAETAPQLWVNHAGAHYKHVCGICEKKFSSRVSLNLHLITHKDFQYPYVCGICGQGFSQLKQLEDHLKCHKIGQKPDKPSVLNKCYREICLPISSTGKGGRKLDAHHMEMHDGHDVTMDTGINQGKAGPVNIPSTEHERKQLAADKRNGIKWQDTAYPISWTEKGKLHIVTYSCGLCSRTKLTGTQLMSHMLDHSNQDLGYCAVCEKKFEDARTFWDHILSHCTVQTHWSCAICSKQMNSAQALDLHMLGHNVCNTASFSFGKEKIPPKQYSHVCHFCGEMFTNKVYLMKHLRKSRHKYQNKYLCTVCGCEFLEYYTLKSHKKMHQCRHSGKPLQGLDGKGLKAKRANALHMEPLVEKRPHGTFSGKALYQKQKLKVVLYRRVVERLHCSVCGKYFASLIALRNHQLTASINSESTLSNLA